MKLALGYSCKNQFPYNIKYSNHTKFCIHKREVTLHRTQSKNDDKDGINLDFGDPQKDENKVESLFMQELKKRGIQNMSDVESTSQQNQQQNQRAPYQDLPKQSSSQSGQLNKSRALVSEGLEGLIPRATVLLKLGGQFIVGFLPLIVVVGLAFAFLVIGFGDQFIHIGGRNGVNASSYVYYDPDELLSESTYDPMVPLR
eukprot:TRINITY_DN12603_c0_g1_i12.p2 TRINITY_DN12603_c0_g1~~TRINITY_DN12603_c0_g1_i12.p2  ORF type:complete len:200 (-),score=21.03 TRINITY_DN12603_c0_g1_i12:2297-2896(-)